MLSEEKKLEITEHIVASNTLKNAPTSIAILRYLVQANIEDRFLKEGIIDIEFFGAKADDDKNNPRVRVNIYNLRKKLKSYYENEGTNDLWQIKIDKGQYAVRLLRKHSSQFVTQYCRIYFLKRPNVRITKGITTKYYKFAITVYMCQETLICLHILISSNLA